MSNYMTLTALIHCRSLAILGSHGWPEHTDAVAVSAKWPCWLGICVRLNAGDLVTLLPKLASQLVLMEQHHELLYKAVNKLKKTKAEMILSQNTLVVPSVPGDNTQVVFPDAHQWLTDEETQTVLNVMKSSIRKVCIQMFDDAAIIQSALMPSDKVRLFERKTRYFRVIAEECDEELWLDEKDPEEINRVLDAILNKGARYGCVRLLVVNELVETIVAYEVMTDVLRCPDQSPRHWLCREAVHNVCSAARQDVVSLMNAFRPFLKKA